MAFKFMFSFYSLYIFFGQKKFTFFLSLYKEVLEPKFLACLTILVNLYEVFACSVIDDDGVKSFRLISNLI